MLTAHRGDHERPPGVVPETLLVLDRGEAVLQEVGVGEMSKRSPTHEAYDAGLGDGLAWIPQVLADLDRVADHNAAPGLDISTRIQRVPDDSMRRGRWTTPGRREPAREPARSPA